MKAFRSFFIACSILTLILGGGIFLWSSKAPANLVYPWAYWLLGVFYVASLLIHYTLIKAGEKEPKLFVRSFLATTTLKLFVYLLVIVSYLFIDKKYGFVFVYHFLVFYFAFTVFEVAMLMRFFRKAS